MSTKEAMDLGGSRRRGGGPKAGSVWESRMKIDEVRGGIKVFDATDENPQETSQNPSSIDATAANNTEIRMDKEASDVKAKQSPGGKRKTWKSESLEGSPVKIASLRSEWGKNSDENSRELSVCDGIKKSPIPIKKTRSGLLSNQSGDLNQRYGIQLRKMKSDFNNGSKIEGDSERKVKSETSNGGERPKSEVERERNSSDEKKAVDESRSDGDCKSPSDDDDFVDGEEGDGKIGVDDKSVDVKETSVKVEDKAEKIVDVEEEKKLLHSSKKSQPISPIVKKQPPTAANHARLHPSPPKINPIPDNSHGIPRTNSKLQSFVDLVMWRDASKSAFVFGIGTFAIISSSYTKDLNISFISVVSYLGLVYLAAIFIFRSLTTRGSMEMDNANGGYVVGEEEAMWVAKLVLPYVNEFLLKLRALFSGDPATTMKLAVLLLILARCGSYITLWKLAKLGFIGVFTVPKVCSTYSSQLTAYGTFWIRRFRDAWETCSHKKAVGFAVFALIWNLSSVVARIWAVFMLFAAFKYYQQSMIKDGWADGGGVGTGSKTSSRETQSIGGQQSGRRFILRETRSKQKKVC